MVTLDEVARRAGMAKSSVAEILRNNGERYAEASRDKVRRVARELGYCPNAAARATRHGRSHAYTLLVGEQAAHSFLPLELLIALDTALSEHGCHLVLRHLPAWEDAEASDHPPRHDDGAILRGVMADGFFVNCLYELPPALTRIIAKNRFPCIYLNRRDPAPGAVHPDDFGDSARLVQRLIADGHRRIAYFDPLRPPDPSRVHYSKTDRREGYRHAMAEAGLTARIFAATATSGIPSRHVEAAVAMALRGVRG